LSADHAFQFIVGQFERDFPRQEVMSACRLGSDVSNC